MNINPPPIEIVQQADGTWIWTWEHPDGPCFMGTADTEDDAEQDGRAFVAYVYSQVH